MRREFLKNTLSAAAANFPTLSRSATLVAMSSVVTGFSSFQSACTGTSGPVPRSPLVQDLDVPFVTTPDNVVLKIIEIGGVSDLDFLLDLGSGDGRIPITAALTRGAHGLGVEIDPQLVWRSKENAKIAKVDHLVDFKVQDLFETDLTQANVITMYLLPDVNMKLRPVLQKLKPGTRIVSHDWDMGDWEPLRTERVAAPEKKVGLVKESKIMLWVVR
jgi:SAM-dependent methyltransferase